MITPIYLSETTLAVFNSNLILLQLGKEAFVSLPYLMFANDQMPRNYNSQLTHSKYTYPYRHYLTERIKMWNEIRIFKIILKTMDHKLPPCSPFFVMLHLNELYAKTANCNTSITFKLVLLTYIKKTFQKKSVIDYTFKYFLLAIFSLWWTCLHLYSKLL